MGACAVVLAAGRRVEAWHPGVGAVPGGGLGAGLPGDRPAGAGLGEGEGDPAGALVEVRGGLQCAWGAVESQG